MLLFFILNLTLPGVSAQGDRIYYSDARSLSLGGASVVLEGAYNPAAMGMVRVEIHHHHDNVIIVRGVTSPRAVLQYLYKQ